MEKVCAQQVWSLAASGNDVLVGTSGTGLCRLHADGKVSQYLHRAGDPTSLPDDIIYALLAGADGQVWVGTAQGLARFNPVDGRVTRIASPLLDGKDIIRLSADRSGGIWAGSRS